MNEMIGVSQRGAMSGASSHLLAITCLLSAWALWAAPVPSGPMADYRLHCVWTADESDAACAALIDRLDALKSRSREEKLALHHARQSLAGLRGDPLPLEAACMEIRAIVTAHPDYAEALTDVALCSTNLEEEIALLRKALDIEPDNFGALQNVLVLVHGIDGAGDRDVGVDLSTLAEYRDAHYEAAKARAEWKASVLPLEYGSRMIWVDLLLAARFIYAAAVRTGDLQAAEALQDRVRRDAGLDTLDLDAEGHCADAWNDDCLRGSGGDSLGLACNRLLYYLGMEDVCLSAVEELAGKASAEGLAIPDDVLRMAAYAVHELRKRACDDKSGGFRSLVHDDCLGLQATETDDVARLRTVLENHGGARSSEHLRVYAQGFLGDGKRLDGLRAALRADPRNVRARCDLSRALAARGEAAEAHSVLSDGDPACLGQPQRGFTWGDRDDFLIWQERELEALDRQATPPPATP